MRPHIAVIGSALSGNKGASAMLEASIATLRTRLPGVSFTLLSMYPDEDRRLNTHDDLEIVDASPRQLGIMINLLALAHRLVPPARHLIEQRSRAVGALAQADVLLDQGGITFTDGREKFLLYNTASILPAFNVGTPVVKCAQAVGPFANRLNRAVSRWFLPRVETLVTRGRRTHEYAVGLGLDNLRPGADYAFALELEGTEAAALAAEMDVAFLEEGQLVGLSPSAVLQKKVDARGEDYVGEMAALVDGLVASGRKVLVVPHSARTHTDATHNNDLPLCRAIMARVTAPGDRATLLEGEAPARVLRHAIGRCDLFVASRFHAMVSALAMAVPTLVIGWGHKYEEVLEMFELTEWALDDSSLDAADLLARVEDLAAQSEAVAARLHEHLPAVKALANDQADLVADLVRGVDPHGVPSAAGTASA